MRFLVSNPCLPSLTFHEFSSWLRLIAQIAQCMQWNFSCETHKLPWIWNFHSYSPGSATVLSQFKFQSMLSYKLLKQSNLYHSIYSQILLESHKQIRGYTLHFLSCIQWMRHNIHTLYSVFAAKPHHYCRCF
jgi:hypothetical protein